MPPDSKGYQHECHDNENDNVFAAAIRLRVVGFAVFFD
jgi:hypothetical protein